MAYTPYSQALPDTSRYTLDPVLQERLYQPVRPDPYQAGMLSTMANDYYADPFGYTNKRFGKLDEVLETDAPEVGLGGLFAPPPQNTGGDSASDTGGRNHYQELEDRLTELNISEDGMDPEDARAAAIKSAFAIQSANNARINAGLTLFGNAMIPGMGAMGVAKYGPTGYADYLQGNARVMVGDTSGYVNPTYQPKPAGVAAPVVTGSEGTTYSPDASYYSAPSYTSAGNDGSSVNNTPDTYTGADVSYGDTSWGTLF